MNYEKKLAKAVVAGIICLIFIGRAAADEIVLDNGDRLTGTVMTLQDGVLTFATGYSDPVKIKADRISRVRTDRQVEVHLISGEVLKGTLSSTVDRQVEVGVSTARKRSVISMETIGAINPPPVVIAWKGKVTIAGMLQSGNTNSASGSVSGHAERKTENDRLALRLLYNYAEENKVRNSENVYGILKYDYFLGRTVFTYLSLEALKDPFKDLRLRSVIGPGLGYQFWDTEGQALSLTAGISYFNEDHESGEDDNWMTGRLGVDFLYSLSARIRFTDQLLIYPNLENSEYQLRNEAGISTDLYGDWSLNLSNILEHNSNPAPTVKKDDTTWLLGLGYSF